MINKIDAAAVTLKRSGTAYNNDSININGKVPSLNSANAGYKGAGALTAPFAVALSSSERNGFAAAALTALNDRLPALKQSGNGFAQVLSDYFCDSEYALEKSRCSSSVLATSVLYGYGSSIVAARMGSAQLYRYTGGELSSIGVVMKPGDDHVPLSSCELIENVADGDLFILCSGGVFSVLSTDEISRILAGADGCAKRAAQRLTTAALAKEGCEDAVSMIVLRVYADDEPAVLPVLPVTPEEAAAAAIAEQTDAVVSKSDAVPDEVEVTEDGINADIEAAPEEESEAISEEAEQEEPSSKAGKAVKRLLTVILVLCGMIVLTFATYKIAGALKKRIENRPAESTIETTTQEESNTEESTTRPESTTGQTGTTTPSVTQAQVFNPNPDPTTRRAAYTNPTTARAHATRPPTTANEETTEPATEAESTEAESTEAENITGEQESATASPEITVAAESTASATTTNAATTTAHSSTIQTTTAVV